MNNLLILFKLNRGNVALSMLLLMEWIELIKMYL